MVNGSLIDHWMGKTEAEITAGWATPPANGWEAEVKTMQDSLTKGALKAIATKAESGDIPSVAWLMGRGLLTMPNQGGWGD